MTCIPGGIQTHGPRIRNHEGLGMALLHHCSAPITLVQGYAGSFIELTRAGEIDRPGNPKLEKCTRGEIVVVFH